MGIGDYTIITGSALGATASRVASNVANNVVRKAQGYATGMVRNAVDSVLSHVPGKLLSLAGNPAEDFNALRHINKQLVHTEFQGDWNFRLEIDGAPQDFDFYVKDITYSHFEIATEEENYGAATLTWPTGDQPKRISFTIRDNIDGRIAVFFGKWWGDTIGVDGTVRLPLGLGGYVRRVIFYNIATDGSETLYGGLFGYPIQVGEVSRSRENAQFMEIPVTLVQFSTLDHHC